MIRQKGLTNVTMEELVSALTVLGRATVPTEVKGEVADRLYNIQAVLRSSNSNSGSGAGVGAGSSANGGAGAGAPLP